MAGGDDASSAREVQPRGAPQQPGKPRKLWALLVGISDYKYDRWNLKYAHADANALYDHLTSPRGGNYPPGQILKLVNAEATREAIWDGLYTFLQQPAADDFVLVFFACHGGPSPGKQNNLYVFPHDTNPDKIAASAISMQHVREALGTSNLGAERVVLLVDACHAGGLNPSAALAGERATVDAADAMNRFFAEMAGARPGMATLTAAEKGESAWEGPEWGGGHGVFTHFLLAGLTGGAARPEDGVVTVGELFDYVTRSVKDATAKTPARTQHPHATLDANTRPWPMAVITDLFADENFELGRALYAVGQRLDDPRRLAQAITEHAEAINLAAQLGRTQAAARYQIGRCKLAAGEPVAALEVFRKALGEALDEQARDASPQLLADLRFWTWATELRLRDPGAEHTATAFAAEHPADPRLELVAGPAPSSAPRRHGFIVAVVADAAADAGTINDARLFRALLLEAGYAAADIEVHDAPDTTTRDAIAAAFDAFREATDGADEVVVFFAGSTVRGPDPEDATRWRLRIATSDYNPDVPRSGLGPADLHAALDSFTARNLIVIADSCYGGGLLHHARQTTRYALLTGSLDHERGEEITIDGVPHGAFTRALVAVLRTPSFAASTGEDVADLITRRMVNGQHAVFVGAPSALDGLVPNHGVRAALALSQCEAFGGSSRVDMERLVGSLPPDVSRALPELRAAIGRWCLDGREYKLAEQIFRPRADDHASDPALALGHAAALAHLGDYAGAVTAFERGTAARPDPTLATFKAIVHGRVTRALLVGVTVAAAGPGAATSSTTRDVRAMRAALEALCGGALEIDELLDDQATRDEILARFRALVAYSDRDPCLFFFAGAGTSSGDPSLRATGWARNEIPLAELAAIAGPGRSNLTCVIDAGWNRPIALPWLAVNTARCVDHAGARMVRPVAWTAPVATRAGRVVAVAPPRRWRDVGYLDPEFAERRAARVAAVAHLAIGGLTIYNASILARMHPEGAEEGERIVEAELPGLAGGAPGWQGVLSHSLAARLLQAAALDSARDLQRSLSMLQWLQPVFIGGRAHDRFLGNVVLEDELERILRQASLDKPLFDAIELLGKRLKRLDAMADGDKKVGALRVTYRELGIAHLAAGQVTEAIWGLQRAFQEDGMTDPEIRGYLGRALVEQGDDLSSAISHLQAALELWKPDAPPAYVHYYHGKALHDRMENRRREDLERLTTAWRAYLQAGAPLGHRDEVDAMFAKLPAEPAG